MGKSVKTFACPSDLAPRAVLSSSLGMGPTQSYFANSGTVGGKANDFATSPLGKKIGSFKGQKILTMCVNAGPAGQTLGNRLWVTCGNAAVLDYSTLHYTPYTTGGGGGYRILANVHSHGTTLSMTDGSARSERDSNLVNTHVTGVARPDIEASRKLFDITYNQIMHSVFTVSYTHLTLPTILLVQISVVAVSLKKKKRIVT
eukprot:TRINITY_DN17885_c0_g1_i3.p1 TRINITY_DN17885_c0_g1~~TRINITY_DN17885_c0_g1_i3.p1  ORF type:complete len:202 (-),score=28.12 TRINITY_DN17885_c0_g1_i3:85-690(-)